MKKWIRAVLATVLLTLMFSVTALAAPKEGTIIALGADLTPEQRATVLSLMGVSEEELSSYTVITITNSDEHQYLDAYLDSSVIGTKALSSVMVTPAESGHGVMVTTQNINYCTTGMYRNALLTAGVEDADILVVGPTEISGTAGLEGSRWNIRRNLPEPLEAVRLPEADRSGAQYTLRANPEGACKSLPG